MADTPVVLPNGARQTGKTTLAQEIAAASVFQCFTLEDATTLGLAVGDPSGFIRNLAGPVVIPRPSTAGIVGGEILDSL